tara:strand:- start:14935 stop:15273 length:339 start_codon:yes stop_codon:yes gene_type:complete
MSKIYARVKEHSKQSGSKQPDFKGSLRIGGFTGQNSDESNKESAMWLKNILEDYKRDGHAWVNLAMWKRVDGDTGDSYLSLCLEDSSWKGNESSTKRVARKNPEPEEDPFEF